MGILLDCSVVLELVLETVLETEDDETLLEGAGMYNPPHAISYQVSAASCNPRYKDRSRPRQMNRSAGSVSSFTATSRATFKRATEVIASSVLP